MTSKNDNEEKIIKSFFVVGLDELKLQKYNDEISLRYIQNVDILTIKLSLLKNFLISFSNRSV